MKKTVLVLVLLAGSILHAPAQVHVSFNIGLQPAWGPVGYDYVQYYYIPDVDAYYDVPNRVYVYFDNGIWVHRPYLPPRYRNVDIYRVHKVVINDRDPWMRHTVYHNRYVDYRGRHDQVIIRDSREQKYWQNPGHPRHNEWRGGRGNYNNQGRGHEDHGGRGHERGHGNGHRR